MCAEHNHPEHAHRHPEQAHRQPDQTRRHPNLVLSVLRNRCPRCRKGHLFVDGNAYHLKRFMKMYEHCPVCGQPFEIEVGFWYGTGFVSYALAVAVCVATFIAWKVLIGMSLQDHRVFWWMGVNGLILVLLQPFLMRLSRTVWLHFFVWYDPEWESIPAKTPERTNPTLKNDW